MALLYRLGAPVAVALGAAAFAVATCSSCDDAHEGAGGSDAAEPDAKLEGGGGTGGDANAEADSPSCIPPKDDGTSLTDPTVWHCIADDRGCGIYVADLSVKTLPAFTWKTCGPGCEEADAVLPIPQPNRTSWPGSSAVEVNGEIVVRLLMEGASTVGYYYQTFRLSDGKTVYAIQFPVKCASAGWTNDGALALPIVDDPFKSVRTVSALSANPGAELAWSNWVNLPGAMPTTFFAWEDGWGLTFMDGSLRVVTSQDATSLTTIDKGAPVYEVASRNHLVVWPGDDGTGQRLVKAWGLQSGLQTLWSTAQALDGSASDYVNSVAVSDKFLVWIVVDGPGYKFTKARMLWSPFATTPAGVSVSEGPQLPAEYSLSELRTGGDYAASKGCYYTGPETGECSIFVVQLSSKKLWKIRPRAGSVYFEVMAVSDDYVLVNERDWPGVAEDSQVIRRLLRFRTAELDALQGAW